MGHQQSRLQMRRSSILLSSRHVSEWTAAEVVTWLRRQKVSSEHWVDAFVTQKVTGSALYEKDADVVSYMTDETASDIELGDDLMMDALLRTEGWSVKKD